MIENLNTKDTILMFINDLATGEVKTWFIAILMMLCIVYPLTILILVILRKLKRQVLKANLLGCIGLFAVTLMWSSACFEKYQRLYEISMADQYVEDGKFLDAYKIYSNYVGYRDVSEKMKSITTETIYQRGIEFEEEGDYINAMKCYLDTYEYEDSAHRFNVCSKLRLLEMEE